MDILKWVIVIMAIGYLVYYSHPKRSADMIRKLENHEEMREEKLKSFMDWMKVDLGENSPFEDFWKKIREE